MITWKEVSPGIFKADYEGFIMHKIETGTAFTGRITCRGERESHPIFSYTAIKPGPPDVTRFAGLDLDKIINQIAKTLQPSLF